MPYFRENRPTVLRVFIHGLPSLTVVAFSYGQRTFTLQGDLRHEALLNLGNGHTLHLCTHDIADYEDSSHCELLWTQEDQVVINARRFRIPCNYAPQIGFSCDIAQLNDGFVVGGGRRSSGPEVPFIVKVGLDGDLEWSGSLTPLYFNQVSIKQIISEGNSFTAYSSGENQIYRINGESSGTVWSGSLISTPTSYPIGVSKVLDGGDHHLLCGQGGEDNLMLMYVADSGAAWINYYHLPLQGFGWPEFAPDLERTSDGDIVLVGSRIDADGIYHSLVLRADPMGTVIWSTELDNVNGGLALRGIHELPGGDLLAVGYTLSGWGYAGSIMRLTAPGDIVWQKSFGEVPYDGPLLSDFFVNEDGDIKLLLDWKVLELDSAGSGCGFTDISEIIATPFTPTVTSIPFTNSPVTLSLLAETFPERTPTASWSVYCDPLGVGAPRERLPLVAHPVPSSDFVQLGEPGMVAENERVIIRDITGALRKDVSYGTALDLRALSCGVYFCELPRTGQRVRVVKQ